MTSPRALPYRAPSDAPPVIWPDAFGQRFTVFCDTEEEFDWSAPLSRTGYGTGTARAIPTGARRLADLGAGVTWMVDHPIAADPLSVDHVRAALTVEGAGIGTQLHPWVNPPFEEAVTPRNSYAGNLPPSLEAAKLDVLTDAIARAFAQRPIIYRAGRYGIGANTIPLLASRGYRFDSSVRSRYDYRADGGPDFRAIGTGAYAAGHGVVELPLTTVFTGAARRIGPRLYDAAGRVPHGRGMLSRSGLLSRIALTPEDMPLAAALEAIRVAAGEGTRLLSLSFHSPSLEPGHTPYVRDARDLVRFWDWWDAVLALMARLGIASASIPQIDTALSPPTRGGPGRT